MASDDWVMVTGASTGIGAETALELARRGWNVALHYRKRQRETEAVAEKIAALGRQTELFQADFSDAGTVEPLVEEAFRRIPSLRAWVQIAGVDLLTGPEAKFTYREKLELALRVDLIGTILTCRSVGQKLREGSGGSIVTIGWDQSATGMEGDTGEIFAGVKGGVAAFTRSLAKSFAPTVRVNCVAPGWIKTAWGETASQVWQDRACRESPLGRWGMPTDIARTIAFLVSSDSEFLTGQTINVGGGAVTS